MVAVVETARADAVAAALTQAGETVVRLGCVEAASGDAPRVAFSGHLDLAG
jgi:phosphoribosylaminoimidazole (AIR) synthetase